MSRPGVDAKMRPSSIGSNNQEEQIHKTVYEERVKSNLSRYTCNINYQKILEALKKKKVEL